MIRCFYTEGGIQRSHLIPRAPCIPHKKGKRSKQVALQVIARDGGRCVHCGSTDRVEAGHKAGYDKQWTGQDDARFMEAQCKSRNRTGVCGRIVK